MVKSSDEHSFIDHINETSASLVRHFVYCTRGAILKLHAMDFGTIQNDQEAPSSKKSNDKRIYNSSLPSDCTSIKYFCFNLK